MNEKEILKKIRRIDIFTNRLVNTVFAGEYHSVFTLSLLLSWSLSVNIQVDNRASMPSPLSMV